MNEDDKNPKFFKNKKAISKVYPNNFPVPYSWVYRSDSTPSELGDEYLNEGLWVTPLPKNKDIMKEVIIKSLKEAIETVMISSFLIMDERLRDTILDLAKKGVRVYLLSAPETMIDKDDGEIEGNKTSLRTRYLNLISELSNVVLLRSAEYFHAKYLLIDPLSNNPKGFVSTANFNKALSENPEILIELNKKQIKSAYNFFVWGFWIESQRENIDAPKQLKPVKSMPKKHQIPETINNVLITLPNQNKKHQPNKTSYKPIHHTIKQEITKLLTQEYKELYIASFGFDENHEITNTIKHQTKAQKLIIFTRPRESQFKAITSLLNNPNIQVLGHEKHHAKFIVGQTINNTFQGMITSANLQEKGLDTGYEIGISLSKRQAELLFKTCQKWVKSYPYKLYKGIPLLSDKGIKIKYLPPNTRDEKFKELILKPKHTIQETKQLNSFLEPITTPNREQIMKRIRNLDFIPLKVEYKLIIQPPILPTKATKEEELTNELKLPIYSIKQSKGKKTYYLAVKNEKEFNKALQTQEKVVKLRQARIVLAS